MISVVPAEKLIHITATITLLVLKLLLLNLTVFWREIPLDVIWREIVLGFWREIELGLLLDLVLFLVELLVELGCDVAVTMLVFLRFGTYLVSEIWGEKNYKNFKCTNCRTLMNNN